MQKKLNNLLILLISLNVIFVFLGAYLYPLASIDAVSIWYLKAKIFYLNHGIIPLDFFKNKIYQYTHLQYPLLVPYIFYLIYLFLGGINENIIAFINPLFYLLIIIVVYKLFKKMEFSTTLSFLFTYIYSMFSPLLAQGGREHSGDADIFIVLINWLVVLVSFNFMKHKNYKYFWSLVVLIMISSQLKGEGIFLASILFFLPVTKKIKFLSIFLAFLPFIIWRIFIFYYQIPNDFYFLIPSIKEIFIRSAEIIFFTFREMIKINNWYFFWPTFLFFIVLGKLNSNYLKKIILPTLITMYGLLFIFYLFLSISPSIYVPASIDRILLQFSPFYYIIFSTFVKEKLFNNSK